MNKNILLLSESHMNKKGKSEEDKSEEDKSEEDKYSVNERAFYFNHIWMFITVIITFVTSFFIHIPLHKYIILMETFISSVSSYIYYLLLKKIQNNRVEQREIDWKIITVLRYNGWTFTTPVMLIAFLLFLSNSTKIKLTLKTVVIIILLDWIMLCFGYLGEIDKISRNIAFVTGFIPFFIIFGIIYHVFLRNKFVLFNYVVFGLFFIFWGLYGVGYLLELEGRNYLMNILDLLSKSGIGLLFTFYFLSIK